MEANGRNGGFTQADIDAAYERGIRDAAEILDKKIAELDALLAASGVQK
jgi:hypothetical protein